MFRFHLTRNLRSFFFLLVASAIAAAVATLWWANQTGLPESWRAVIERELGREGLHMEIGALSYLPLRGVAASKVRIYADEEKRQEISRVERVLLDFDKTKLARGIIQLNKVDFRDVALSLPVDPDRPDSETVEVLDAHGTILMPGRNRIEIRDARGRISGIMVHLDARITGRQHPGGPSDHDPEPFRHRELVARVFEELDQWRFDATVPPELRIFIENDANRAASRSARIRLDARGVEKNGHHLDELSAEAEMHGDLLTVTRLNASDSRGSLDARLDYNLDARDGRFDIQTSLEIAPLLMAWFGVTPPGHVLIGGGQVMMAEGGFSLGEGNRPDIHMTGHAFAESVMIRGVSFDAVESAFAWRDGELFLRDAKLVRADGEVAGKAMIQWPQVRLAMRSTLPAAICQPFFAGMPLEQVIDDFSERENASLEIRLEGGFDASERLSWAYTGSGVLRNHTYKDVPVDYAECRFSVNHHEQDFHDGTVIFNHRDYKMRRDFDGPVNTTAKVGRIRYVAAEKHVEVEAVEGDFWAAPMVRLFAPAVADSLEIYRFHKPPRLRGDGVVDVTPQGRTRLDVAFESAAAADYAFLGQNITLANPAGKVRIRGPRVLVRDLTMNAFDGPLTARFTHQDDGRLDGEVTWTRLSLPALTSTYGYQVKGGGMITGRIEFTMTDGKVGTMNGEGLLALEKTELFSVPVFGPLSPLISGVLRDRRAGFERAKDAFCNFRIRDGVMRTGDFQTATKSLKFVGEGEVDLTESTIDMTMRMNARGLLGLITLPLKPFYGMFQFRGTGPLRGPEWKNVIFSAPSEEQEKLLMTPPRAQIVPVDQ